MVVSCDQIPAVCWIYIIDYIKMAHTAAYSVYSYMYFVTVRIVDWRTIFNTYWLLVILCQKWMCFDTGAAINIVRHTIYPRA